MRKQSTILYLVLGSGALLAGCQRSPATSSATPKPKPTPPPFSAVSTGVKNLIVFDKTGTPVLALKAASAGANAESDAQTLVVQDGSTTLYQKGKPTATLAAQKITAHVKSRIVEASGNVTVKSLTQKAAPTIRADRMNWEHDKNLLTGSGNVLVTAEPAYALPADSFTADTRLSHYRAKLGTSPGSGTY